MQRALFAVLDPGFVLARQLGGDTLTLIAGLLRDVALFEAAGP
jgi:hypothetical protein